MGKNIEVGGILFGCLIPYVTEIINKFKRGADGRTAYERITGHQCRHAAMGLAEKVEFMLETNKSDQHKADGRGMTGVFRGYIRRTTEYIVGTDEAVCKCRTIRRKTEDFAYDPTCVDYRKISYNEYVFKDARSSPIATRAHVAGGQADAPVAMCGREFVPM